MHDLAESDAGPPPLAHDLPTVQSALAGNAVARQRLVELLVDLPAMIRIKNARLGNPLHDHELDDVVQNVLLSLWQKLASYDGRVPLLHWAYGFGVIEILRARRSRRREPGETTPDVAAVPPAEPDGRRSLLQQALAQLDAPEREIVRMRHFDGMSFEAIAARVGVVPGTAKTRYYRGLERLRARLRARGDEHA